MLSYNYILNLPGSEHHTTIRAKGIFSTWRKRCVHGVTLLRAIVILCILPLPLGSAVKSSDSLHLLEMQAIEYRMEVLRQQGIGDTQQGKPRTHNEFAQFSNKFISYSQ